jgi:hypothetical protein
LWGFKSSLGKLKTKRKLLIITDNGAVTKSAAENIAAILGTTPFADWSAAVIFAKDFSPTMLLSASAFLLGCEKSEPPEFTDIKVLFKHINLAGRSCGVFSPQANAVKYLAGLVRDSEAVLGEPLVVNKGAPDSRKLKKWVGGIIGGKA